MDHLAVARPELDGGDRLVAIDRDRDHKTALDVGSGCRDLVGLGHFEHEVRLAKLPPLGELRRGGENLGIALGRPALHPVGDRPKLVIGQTSSVVKRSEAWLGLPGRHLATGRYLDEVVASLRGVPVSQK